MWKLSWFLRDFGYDAELLGKNEIDEKALLDLWGVVKVSEATVQHFASELRRFAPAGRWKSSPSLPTAIRVGRRCPHDLQLHTDQPSTCPAHVATTSATGWLEGERHRAAMLFGRAFEQA